MVNDVLRQLDALGVLDEAQTRHDANGTPPKGQVLVDGQRPGIPGPGADLAQDAEHVVLEVHLVPVAQGGAGAAPYPVPVLLEGVLDGVGAGLAERERRVRVVQQRRHVDHLGRRAGEVQLEVALVELVVPGEGPVLPVHHGADRLGVGAGGPPRHQKGEVCLGVAESLEGRQVEGSVVLFCCFVRSIKALR